MKTCPLCLRVRLPAMALDPERPTSLAGTCAQEIDTDGTDDVETGINLPALLECHGVALARLVAKESK